MPLRDHFHSPWRDENFWEGFHSAWANTIVRYLNGSALPRRYRAVPQVHLGAMVEADVATFEKNGHKEQTVPEGGSSGGVATAIWSPPEPALTLVVDFPRQDLFAVQILDSDRAMRLVGVIELVSPGSKDRPESRRAFATKCAAYLQQQVGVLIVDVVTERKANLHKELLDVLALKQGKTESFDLYAAAYRTRQDNGQWRFDCWPVSLAVGQTLPTLPLWLAEVFSVPIDLEKTYQETCHVLRID